MIEELKPCPFCGEEGFLEKRELPDRPGAIRFFVCCRNGACHLKVETSLYSEEERAIAAWNMRTDPTRAALVKALKEIRDDGMDARTCMVVATNVLEDAGEL